MRAVAVSSIIAMSLVGCYRPEIAPCFLACGTNDACPDGLACNANGVCARSANDPCTAMPGDDGDVDSPPSVMTTVTIDVVSPKFMPEEGVRIVFSTADGQMIKDTRTPSSGHVVVEDVPTGSNVTIIRVSGNDYSATTYLDLWVDAHITSRFSTATGADEPLLASWDPPPGNAPTGGFNYMPYHTCFSGEISQTNPNWSPPVPNNCPKVDVMVLAKDISNKTLFAAVAPDVDVATQSVHITQSMWQAIVQEATYDLHFTNLPNATNEAQLSGYQTPAHAYTTPFSKGAIPPSGQLDLPYPTPIAAVLAIPSRADRGSEHYQQMYLERLPVGNPTVILNMAGRQLPWINLATLDPSTKAFTVPIEVETGPMYAMPSVVFAELTLSRGLATHKWHVFGRGEHLQTTGMGTMRTGTFTLPEIPGTEPFEPLSTDSVVLDQLSVFAVTPGTENALRERLESHEITLDIFGTPNLSYVVKATAF